MKGQDLSLDIRFRESSFYLKCQGEKHSKLKDQVLGSSSEPVRALGLIHPSTAFLNPKFTGHLPPSQNDQQVMCMSAPNPHWVPALFFFPHFCPSGSRVSEEGRMGSGALAEPPAGG